MIFQRKRRLTKFGASWALFLLFSYKLAKPQNLENIWRVGIRNWPRNFLEVDLSDLLANPSNGFQTPSSLPILKAFLRRATGTYCVSLSCAQADEWRRKLITKIHANRAFQARSRF